MSRDYILLGVCIFLFFVLPMTVAYYLKRRAEETERLKGLSQYVLGDFQDFQEKHEDYSEAKALRKFFSNWRNLKKAYEEERKKEEVLDKMDDMVHKTNVANRVFAYDYEETIFEIFSKRAYYFAPEYPTEKIKYYGYSIKKDVFIAELSSKLKLTKDEADKLFMQFLNKNIISKAKNDDCSIGYTLGINWSVVSKNDLNFTRWMEAHPEIKAECRNMDEVKAIIAKKKK